MQVTEHNMSTTEYSIHSEGGAGGNAHVKV